MISIPADESKSTSNGSEAARDIVIYGLIAVFTCLSIPWEFSPYPISQLSLFSTGAGEFFESRVFLYISILILTYIWFISSCLKGRFCFSRTGLGVPILLFMLVALVSILQFNDLHAGLDTLFLISSYILFFYLVVNNFRSFRDIRLFIFTLIAVGAVLSLYGIYQYLVGFQELAKYISKMSVSVDIPSRVFTIFISPNHLAGFLIMIIPLAFVLTLNTKKSWKKIAVLTALILMLDCVFLTYSRGGWISLGLVIAVIGVGYTSIKRKDALINLALVAILVMITAFSINAIGNTLSPHSASYTPLSTSQSVLSAQGRFMLWKGAMRIIETHPLRGMGLGAFASVYPFFQYGGLYSKHVHNVYLEVFAETGILGISSFLTVFFLILLNGVRLAKKKQAVLNELGIALLAGSLGFMVHSLVDFEWSMAAAGLLFWGISGLVFCCSRLTNECEIEHSMNREFKVREANRLPLFLFVSTVALILLLILVSSAWAQHLSNQARGKYEQKQIASATFLMEKASTFDPINGSFKHKLAQVYFEAAASTNSEVTKNPLMSKAIKVAKGAIRLQPYWADHYAQLAILYSYKGDRKSAIKYYRKSQMLYPKNPLFKVLAGEFYYSQENYKKAEVQFKKALSLRKYYLIWYPENARNSFERAHLGLGFVYKETRDLDKAKTEFEKVLAINSRNKVVKKELKNIKIGR